MAATSDSLTCPGGGPWDLLVVGGGTAGLVAAQTAGALGARVLLAERDRTGGDCLWTGCVPSKSLLAAAHAAATARGSGHLGVHAEGVRVDFAAAMAHVRAAIARIEPVDSPDALRAAGASVVAGTARFTGPGRAEVDGEPVAFLQALVATGAAPWVPDLPGLAGADPLTSESVWGLDRLPERLLVLGGGPVGCELAQAFARLGSGVVLLEVGDRLLPREHPDAAARVQEALRADGVEIRLGARLASVAPARAGAGEAVLDGDGGAEGPRLPFDRVLVAAGRRARVGGLGLDAVGVALDDGGTVRVDDRLRTTGAGIWAAGDVTGLSAFTHSAGSHGSLAASNALLGLRRSVSPGLIPRVTYTQPEVASVGAVTPPKGGTARRTTHDEVDRAVTEGETGGYSELVLDRRGRVAGGTVVGPRAGESLAEVVLAAGKGLSARALAGTMHAYPTWSDGVWKSALAQLRVDLGSATAVRATSAMLRARRAWLLRRRG